MKQKFSIHAAGCAAAALLLSAASCNKPQVSGTEDIEVQEIVITEPADGQLTLIQGDTERIRYSVVPESAKNAKIEWSIDDPNIASVKNARVTAIAPGEATITASAGKATKTVRLKVRAIPVESFSLPAEMNVYVGAESEISLTVNPEDANAGSFDWTVADEEIAVVEVREGTAYVKAVKADGKTRLMVAPKEEYDDGLESQEVLIRTFDKPAAIKYFDKAEPVTTSDLIAVSDGETVDFKSVKSVDKDGNLQFWFSLIPFRSIEASKLTVTSGNKKVYTVSTGSFDKERGIAVLLSEGEETGAAEISLSYSDDKGEATMSFIVNKGGTPFGDDAKIWKSTAESVKAIEEMSRNATLRLFLNEGYRARWTSSNEKIATIEGVEASATGYASAAIVKTADEYGESTITATDDTGKKLSFIVKVRPAHFPEGTKIGYMTASGPAGISTVTLRATYDESMKYQLCLIDASGSKISFDSAKWEASGDILKLSQTTGSETVLSAKTTRALSSGETIAKLTVTDDEGSVIKCDVKILQPFVFGNHKIKAFIDDEETTMIDIGQNARIVIWNEDTKEELKSSLLKWKTDKEFGNIFDVTPMYWNDNGKNIYRYDVRSIKKGKTTVTAIDQIGKEISATFETGDFHLTKDMKIYYNYASPDPSASGWKELTSGAYLYGVAYLKLAKSEAGSSLARPGFWTFSETMKYTSAEKKNMSDYHVACVKYEGDYETKLFISINDSYSSSSLSTSAYLRNKTVFSSSLILYYSTDQGETWKEEPECSNTGGTVEIQFKGSSRAVSYKFATAADAPGMAVSWDDPKSAAGYSNFSTFRAEKNFHISGTYAYLVTIIPKSTATFPLDLKLGVTDDNGYKRTYTFHCHK